MATHCEVCGRPLKDRKNRFCLPHAKATLKAMERSGYLQPLTISTVNGPNQRLSRHRFLTLRDEEQANSRT